MAFGEKVKLPTVSVIIPTLNEAENLAVLLPQMPEWLTEIVIVDGHSVDETIEVAQALSPKTRIVIAPGRGKGAALRAGFAAASGEIIVAIDADCSMHPREMVMLVSALLAGGDVAKGSRFIQGGGTTDMSSFRMFGNWSLTQAVRLLYGGSYSDLCYGYFAFWRKHLDVFMDATVTGFEVETFIKVRALKAHLRVVEVPSFEAPRLYGESNLRAIPDGWRVLKTIVRERFSEVQVKGV